MSIAPRNNPFAHGTLRGRLAEAQRNQPRISLRDVSVERFPAQEKHCPICNVPTDAAGDGAHATWCSRR